MGPERVKIHGMPTIALTRAVSPRIAECELTHIDRTPIDSARAVSQHAVYERQLAVLGCDVRRVAPAPDLADSVFIEDTAIVLPEVAIITRPGAASRRGETASVRDALAVFRPLIELHDGETLDGGDALHVGRTLYLGESSRSNRAAHGAVRRALGPFGYEVVSVPLRGALHLKTAVCAVSRDTVLLNPEWVDATVFGRFEVVRVDATEPFAANILRLGDVLLHDEAHVRTRARLEAMGERIVTIDASELAKAEGGVTCCSLIFDEGAAI